MAVLLGMASGVAVRLVAGPERPGRPNLVLIVTDDQRSDTLSVMPQVRRLLAHHGVMFRDAFVTSSLCCPSRASILTGRYSRHTGVYNDAPPQGGAPSFHDASTLATWLHGAGYRTALVGKYLNDYSLLRRGYIPPGWDEWDAIAQDPMIRYYDYTLNENGHLVRFGSAPSDYSTNALAGRAIRFIQQSSRPFFLYFAPIAPHVPATPAPQDARIFAHLKPARPPSFGEADVSDKPWGRPYGPPVTAHDRAVFDGIHRHMLESLRAVDRAVGQIVGALAARGTLDNTVIAFTSDNGYLLGEHRLLGKVWPYEESIRVPLVVRLPWQQPPGRVERRPVLNIDLAPTFAELGGATPGPRQDGRSLVPLLRNRKVGWRSAFVVEFLGRQHEPNIPPPFEAIRTERFLYVEYTNGWRELYDLRADRFELHNRAADPAMAGVRDQLAALLLRLTAT